MSLETKLNALALAIAGDIKNLRTTRGDVSTLTTTEKSNLVGALNELKALVDTVSGGVGNLINDTAAATNTTYSSTKITADIAAAVTALVDSSPGALNTLNELAAAIGDDANFAATITAALGARLRFDAAQTLTAGEKTQGLDNLGAAAVTDFDALVTAIGDTDADLALAYTTARDAP